MLTKIGQDMEKQAYASDLLPVFGGVGGAVTANALTPRQKKILTTSYGMNDNAMLKTRNFGRGYLGAAGGGAAGQLLGHIAGRGNPIAAALGGAVGAILGQSAMTDKYSPRRAERLAKRLKALELDA